MVRIGYFVLLSTLLSDSCEKAVLIDPEGIETNIAADSIVFAQIGDFGASGSAEA
ncbi:MAG: hypothetical protein H6Q21_2285, partial [Bacteroidetes bacterium]|nr:hypothetical protein [Bacteroidota bacterium]